MTECKNIKEKRFPPEAERIRIISEDFTLSSWKRKFERSGCYALPFTDDQQRKLPSDLAQAAEKHKNGLWSILCFSWPRWSKK